MKKILKYLLALMMIIGLGSCTGKNISLDTTHISYKGHDYIVFEYGPSRTFQNYSMSVVHDPDCPCNKH
jgi:uncharacterized protein YxeA|nr:MAG TPA: protein of unknown function (DUF4969) [Caudoviricetes sp.]